MVKRSHDISPSTFQTFGELLKYLRERARLSQRELARQVGYHYSYMSRLESNVRLPDEITLRTRFVPALGIEDEPAFVQRLLELAAGGEAPVENRLNGAIPASGAVRSGALPVILTSLLGREAESATLLQILSSDEVRLVTLIGPPGVGKTRLSLHVAEQLAERFEDGVVFVDLMPVLDAGQVIFALASALGTQETVDTSALENVQAALHGRQMLIVMDNFEQVLDAAPQIMSLLASAPGVKILATSREALRIRGEQEFPLSPLAVPDGQNVSLLDFPSVRLFLQRAQAAQPGFVLTEEDASRVAEICRRLDGLPLAIELAAARIRTFSLRDMLEQFDRRFQWLALTARDIPEWRRTLWSAIAWSFNLLTEKERILFARLSIFSGGWTIESAEAVCADETCPQADILPMLLQLADKSLMVIESEGRYRFLDTIAKFAFEKLNESGTLDDIARRHLLHFADWAEALEGRFNRIGPLAFQKQTKLEQNNIRAALDWSLNHRDHFLDGLRLAIPANLIWLEHGLIREEYDRARIFLRRATDPAFQTLLPRLLLRTAALGLRIGQGSLAYRYCLRAEELARRLNDTTQLAAALLMRGDIERDTGKFEQAIKTLTESVELYRGLNLLSELSLSLSSLGNALYFGGRPADSHGMLEEAIAVATPIDDLVALGAALRVRAITQLTDKKYEDALDTFHTALDVAHESGDRPSAGVILANLCLITNILEDYPASARYASEAVSVFHTLGDEDQQAFPKRMHAYALLHQGYPGRARSLALESLRANLQDNPGGNGVFACLVALTEIKFAEGNLEDSAKLYAYLNAHARERIRFDSDVKALERLTQKFSKLETEHWQKQGKTMVLESIIEIAQR